MQIRAKYAVVETGDGGFYYREDMMAENKTRISTVIPVYNAEQYLERCIDSVLQQNMENNEIICVDDGSTDKSLSILQEYADRYPNFRFIRQENQHAGIARNVGLQHAKGEYIHFLDADDYLFPGFYRKLDKMVGERQIDYVKFRNQTFDMCTGEVISRNGYTLNNIPSQLWGSCVRLEDFPEVFLTINPAPWTGIVRKKFIIENGIRFNNLICCNDRSFYVQVICQAKSILFCDLYGVYYQINNDKSLIGIRRFHFGCHFRSYAFIEEFVDKARPSLKWKIMSGELRDLLVWYKTLDESEAYVWRGQLQKFLKGINIMDLDYAIIPDYLLGSVLDEFGISPLAKAHTICNASDFKKILTCNQPIYLYGAGKVAERFFEANRQAKFIQNIVGIYVTILKQPGECFHGIPICMPENNNECENRIVVVTVTKRYQLAIFCNLCKKGYKNIFLLSQEYCMELLKGC